MTAKDFTATAEQISLHGLGFLQIKLGGNQRMHVWHPDLPRRSCFAHSAIHNHRFSFHSKVLVGTQINRRYAVTSALDGSHDRISHDGPRSAKGGRLSYIAERVDVMALSEERYAAGQSYLMPALHYHETPNDGAVVTVLTKLVEGTVHASYLITSGISFDQSFDRFQMDQDRMWAIAVDALRSAA